MAKRRFLTINPVMNSIEDLGRMYAVLDTKPHPKFIGLKPVPKGFFPLYYGHGTWVVCFEDGALESAFHWQSDAELRADLLNFMYGVDNG